MGGHPVAALISLGLPPEFSWGTLADIYRGLQTAFLRRDAQIAGGNIARADQLMLDLTLLGRIEEGRALTRSGARPGDIVFATGPSGRSAAALAALRTSQTLDGELRRRLRPFYVTPRARITAGRYLAVNGIAHAAIDQSDGLVGDLGQICGESGVGIVLDEDLLPVDPDLARLASLLEQDPLNWVLGASDDYELLFAVSRDRVDLAFALPGAVGVPAVPLGSVVDGEPAVRLRASGGELRELTGGWDHLA
jgi:thiamine-monophosphate kinase